MGFTVTKAKPKGDQSRQTQKRKVAGKKRAASRAADRRMQDALKMITSPRMQAIQDFMGKTGYGGMSKKKKKPTPRMKKRGIRT